MQVYHHRRFQRLHYGCSHGTQTLDVYSRLLTIHPLHIWLRPTRWVLYPVQNMLWWWRTRHCHSQAVYTPPGRHSGPSYHHKRCPTGYYGRPPLCLNRGCWRVRSPISLEMQLRQEENIWEQWLCCCLGGVVTGCGVALGEPLVVSIGSSLDVMRISVKHVHDYTLIKLINIGCNIIRQ